MMVVGVLVVLASAFLLLFNPFQYARLIGIYTIIAGCVIYWIGDNRKLKKEEAAKKKRRKRRR